MAHELVDWLREQIAEDERVAKAGQGEPVDAPLSEPVHAHLRRWNAARALAEVAAKRAILDLHEPRESEEDGRRVCWTCGAGPWPCLTIRALASAYAGRPAWRDG